MRSFSRSSVAGLGFLALSCAGMKLPTLPNSVGGVVQTVNTGIKTYRDASACEKLAARPSVEEEYTLGGAVALNWVQRGGGLIELASHKELVTYLNVVGKNLGAQSSRPTLRWTFGVLRTESSVNALSTPGGYILVTRKLLQSVENEAQLAGVLAHEIAHVTERHVLNRYSQVKVGQCQRAVAIKGGKEAIGQNGGDLTPAVVDDLLAVVDDLESTLNLDLQPRLLTSFTDGLVQTLTEDGLDEKEEFAADEEAARLLLSAGYDPQEYVTFLSRLPDSQATFGHHPRSQDRTRKLSTFLRGNKSSGSDFPELAAGTEGLVRPPLPPSFASVKKAVARDKP
ncbi:M48 family metallopeptidase [Hyalangium gracile]|uniref:M48 family metallopeptidase n=1 Tax=Hyalangium gracile TaxID=394092 RepID=UPI001CCAC32D|nr:M48 family metallopeptidase [Hyalangium gracile]